MTRHGYLLRILGVSFGIAVTIGGTLGVGILRTPGLVAAQLGDAWAIQDHIVPRPEGLGYG